jgi:hypothetical protein
MGDASVKRIKNEIDFVVWWAMGTRAGNESFEVPQ